MGPLTEHLVHHAGYVTCTDAIQTPGNVLCFHVHRMPLPPLLLAALVRIFGNRYLAVDLTKIALVLIPVAAAFSLIWQKLYSKIDSHLRWQASLLLFLCLMLPTLIVDVIHLQVEEGYSFCLLAYALAVLLFGVGKNQQHLRSAVLFALAVAGLYLTKSSMVLACTFLVGFYCWSVSQRKLRAVVLLITICAPLGWGLYSLHVTGRFTLGTSLDGINLHKGNNADFLERYPPANDGSLDRYDALLSDGRFFANEWDLNDYHTHASLIFMKAHPVEDMRGDLRKADIFFLSFRKIGSERYRGMLGLATDASMLVFRLLLWSACLLALHTLWRGTVERRRTALLYIGIVLTVAAPYIVGFAFTRHASVLILPSALYLIHWRLNGNSVSGASRGAAPEPA
ncbi:MAG TPA: hypothetical protein VHX63_13730 [Acidobacteriaceae bacterium]|nr:hypothetical protein [Acidobacteriaceae bacterium]